MELILIHGALGAAPQMAPLAEKLGGRFDTHILKLEGHGETLEQVHVPLLVSLLVDFFERG